MGKNARQRVEDEKISWQKLWILGSVKICTGFAGMYVRAGRVGE
jgi:hypothetical protein